MAEEFVYLPSPGHLPPLPGSHGPGAYLVDYAAGTIRPVMPEDAPVEQEVPTPEPEPEIEQPVVPVEQAE